MSPFFVIGNPRSGTSLLRVMLNSHPEIAVPPECGFALHLRKTFQYKSPYTENLYREFAHSVSQSRKFETWDVPEREVFNELIRTKPTNYPSLCSAVYLAYAHKKGKNPKAVGDKNNYFIERLQELRATFPESKLIFIVRDGRDVACSYREVMKRKIASAYRPKLPSEIHSIAAQWKKSCQGIIKNLGDQTTLVRYEDLIEQTEPTLKKIHDFLGLAHKYEPNQHIKSQDEPLEFMAWKEKLQSAPDKSRLRRYIYELSDSEVREFEKEAGEELCFFGYK